MKLFEYEGKEIFSKYGIPIPKGFLTADPSIQLGELKFPVAIKAQVLTGRRGKGGGIRFASDPVEAKKALDEMIGIDIQGFKVKHVLIEEKLDVLRELYTSVSLDRDLGSPVMMISAEGGMEVEEIEDEKIYKKVINPLIGIQQFMVRNLLNKIDLEKDLLQQTTRILFKLYNMFNDFDALLVEINPLAVTKNGKVVVLDSKITIDDNALFRHPDLRGLDRGLTPFEKKALELGVPGAVEIGGEIGVIANGTGCLLATIDTIKSHGGNIAATIDLGGVNTFDPEMIQRCVSVMMDLNPKVILFNAFPTISRWDIYAEGILNAIKHRGDGVSVVCRVKGNKANVARRMFKASGRRFVITDSFVEACKKAVKEARVRANKREVI